MRELSLFSGAGGGLLATQHLLGWRALGYVEIDDYCQRIIAQRIRDGLLHDAPIFGDVRAFLSDGYAESYHGMVDVVSAGFPCQPFSVAGKRLGEDDPRNMWPATLAVVRAVRPRYAFLENVPGLLAGSHGYFGQILGGLAESGYDARWRVLSAAELGAPHRRDRLWVVADATELQFRQEPSTGVDRVGCAGQGPLSREEAVLADAEGERTPTTQQSECACRAEQGREDVASAAGTQGATEPNDEGDRCGNRQGWWATEPDVC